ncbi:outer membrane beta-barrel protein [Hymenobacter sp. BT770]|uniref:outer membrane beta-barrel protein n=1 Tax=Hymenobacter sp. BT770 TaxID=2886942 RepID=UPI001D11F5E5|nr:outer membrane beta-barrel protein [Hymenobacter sp. BT770]MCC3154631.1 porin family protein [Hymenobacter sp. BT770]MDO3416684.1 outer membrane beta-barrel protein [Hymenobacter sp. BT770]
MLLSRLAAFSSLLLSTPLLTLAQTADPTSAPRFYVGLGAYSSYYQHLGNRGFLGGVQVPVQLTVGYQWRPRLAVQVGLAYSGMSHSYSNSGYFYDYATGSPVLSYSKMSGRYTGRNASMSVLARYTLTRNPAHRLQFDALGGLTLEHRASSSSGTRSDSVQSSIVTSPYGYRYSHNMLLLTLGMGARYRITPRFEVTYDFTINRAVAPGYYLTNSYLTHTNALGLRYRFGSK